MWLVCNLVNRGGGKGVVYICDSLSYSRYVDFGICFGTPSTVRCVLGFN